MKEIFEANLRQCPLIAILRGITLPEIPAVCDALLGAGITLLEIPLNTPDACRCIAAAIRYCAGRQLVGAGTVLTPEEVQAVKAAGGAFVISPNTDAAVIRETKACGMLSMPGFFTATEGLAALRAGADYLKLFPAVLGPGYVRDLKAVIRAWIFAVGGVNRQNLPDLLQVCAGAGIGSALYKPGKSPAEVALAARELTSAVKHNGTIKH
ncbi:MAG: 2-dehydro-3-deoxy-6-phosphogalactonate aldolase [Lentisphaeria bacterium]|nr:2-dehydro-3-deoxy-6-phosphogalactonate aldolase [Lentisphaeria bacterium]